MAGKSLSNRPRKSRRISDRSRISVIDVFRTAFDRRDANATAQISDEGDGRNTVSQVTGRSTARRIGVSDEDLRAHVRDHLATLMNTIRLDAAVDLEDCPNIAQSVVNFGFQDLSNLTRNELCSRWVEQSIKTSLTQHEPRLAAQSIEVKVEVFEDDEYQRVGVHVMADLIADPADIPIDFVADVDTGAGKIILNAPRI